MDADIQREIENKIREIWKKSDNGNYIYRGEPQCYEKTSSTLYREWQASLDSGRVTMEEVQEYILRQVRQYPSEKNKQDFNLLCELQHYGGATNLIDFTTDRYKAIFFACNGFHDKPGRVLLLEQTERTIEKYQIKKPDLPQNRVKAQSSIFAQPPDGFIDPDDVISICIPKNIKQWLLIHLRRIVDISIQTIYNDLHGYIKHKNMPDERKAMELLWMEEFFMKQPPNESITPEVRRNQVKGAIKALTKIIQYSPYKASNYVKQGEYYFVIRKFDDAIDAASKAITLDPNNCEAHDLYNRAQQALEELHTKA